MTGALCSSCIDEGYHFDSSTARCRACEATGAEALWPLPVMLVMAAIAIGLLGKIREQLHRIQKEGSSARLTACVTEPFESFVEYAGKIIPQLGLVGKLKLLIAYFQVISAVPNNFSIELPEYYHDIMAKFEIFGNLDWFEWTIPAACIGSFRDRLILKAVSPIVFLGVVILGRMALAITMRWMEEFMLSNPRPRFASAIEAAAHGFMRTLPFTLVVLFAIVPPVCTRIFSAFSCRSFGYNDDAEIDDGERRYLVADLGEPCYGESYDQVVGTAWVFIWIWPIGVPAFFFGLLWLSRKDPNSELSRAIAFLHQEYKQIGFLFCWELLELARKLVLTGFVQLIPPPFYVVRLVIALLLTIAYLVWLAAAAPFKQTSTFFFAIATNMTLAFSLIAASLLKVYETFDDEKLPDGIGTTRAQAFFGFDDIIPLTNAIIIFNFSVLFWGLVFLCHQLEYERRVLGSRWLRTGKRGDVVHAPSLNTPHKFHLCESRPPLRMPDIAATTAHAALRVAGSRTQSSRTRGPTARTRCASSSSVCRRWCLGSRSS